MSDFSHHHCTFWRENSSLTSFYISLVSKTLILSRLFFDSWLSWMQDLPPGPPLVNIKEYYIMKASSKITQVIKKNNPATFLVKKWSSMRLWNTRVSMHFHNRRFSSQRITQSWPPNEKGNGRSAYIVSYKLHSVLKLFQWEWQI